MIRVVENYTRQTGDYQTGLVDAIDANSGERLRRVPLKDMFLFPEAPTLDEANPFSPDSDELAP